MEEAEMLAVTKNAINYRVTIIASVVESAPLNGRESLLLTTTPPDLLSHSGRFILLLALNERGKKAKKTTTTTLRILQPNSVSFVLK